MFRRACFSRAGLSLVPAGATFASGLQIASRSFLLRSQPLLNGVAARCTGVREIWTRLHICTATLTERLNIVCVCAFRLCCIVLALLTRDTRFSPAGAKKASRLGVLCRANAAPVLVSRPYNASSLQILAAVNHRRRPHTYKPQRTNAQELRRTSTCTESRRGLARGAPKGEKGPPRPSYRRGRSSPPGQPAQGRPRMSSSLSR